MRQMEMLNTDERKNRPYYNNIVSACGVEL